MDKRRPRICLVGLGRAGSNHLRALQAIPEELELFALADEVGKRLQATADAAGVARRYTSLDEALQDPEIDCVDLCLPNDLHESAVLKSVAAGKHMIVEKPLSNTVKEADSMIAAAESAGLTLMCGQSRRFFPAVMRAQEIVASGGIGRLIGVHASYFGFMERPQTPWWQSAQRTGGLMLPQWGSHILDFILWLYGERPSRVYMEASNNNPNWEGEDELAITLGFANKGMATCIMSWNARPVPGEKALSTDWGAEAFSYERFIVGTEGTLQLRDERELFWNGKEELRDTANTDNFAVELTEFANALREQRTPIASGREVRPVVEVMEACRASAASHEVITIP